MRTTITIDEDLAARLKAEARSSGKPFRVVVNEYLRLALKDRRQERARDAPFEIRPRDLGALRPGLCLDRVGELLATAEGPTHR